jgi:hypothetical protein
MVFCSAHGIHSTYVEDAYKENRQHTNQTRLMYSICLNIGFDWQRFAAMYAAQN